MSLVAVSRELALPDLCPSATLSSDADRMKRSQPVFELARKNHSRKKTAEYAEHAEMQQLFFWFPRISRFYSFWLGLLATSLTLLLATASASAQDEKAELASCEHVGQLGTNFYQTPVHQKLTPAGKQVELPGLRPQAIALSPDGRLLAVSGKTPELVMLDPISGNILQRVTPDLSFRPMAAVSTSRA